MNISDVAVYGPRSKPWRTRGIVLRRGRPKVVGGGVLYVNGEQVKDGAPILASDTWHSLAAAFPKADCSYSLWVHSTREGLTRPLLTEPGFVRRLRSRLRNRRLRLLASLAAANPEADE